MKPLLYLTSFGSLLVLFISVLLILGSMLRLSVRGAHRLYRILTGSEEQSLERRYGTKASVLDTNQLKRAGQW
jgi:hypothetical protein